MNVLLVHGYYDLQDKRLIDGIKDLRWYLKPRGEINHPFPYITTVDMWDINDDYEDFVNWMSRRIDFEHGNVVVVTPNRDETFLYPTVQLKHPARLAQLVRLGVVVHL